MRRRNFVKIFKIFALKKKKRVHVCCVVWSKVSFLSTLRIDKIRLREEDDDDNDDNNDDESDDDVYDEEE